MTDPVLSPAGLVTVPTFDFSKKIKVHIGEFQHLFVEVHKDSLTDDAVAIHYYSLAHDKDGRPMVRAMLEWLFKFVTYYALHNRKIDAATDVPAISQLTIQALSKFQSAGGDEAGEFLLWAFLEAILRAPQAVAKMSHKDNSESPVLGSDAVHAAWDEAARRLTLLFGESKLQQSASDCIGSAFKSLEEAISTAGIQKERTFLTDYPSQLEPGLETKLEAWWLSKPLDFEVAYAYAFLLGFDLPAYLELAKKLFDDPRKHVQDAYRTYHANLKQMLQKRLPLNGRMPTQQLYVFFLPFSSVGQLRDEFLRLRRGDSKSPEPKP